MKMIGKFVAWSLSNTLILSALAPLIWFVQISVFTDIVNEQDNSTWMFIAAMLAVVGLFDLIINFIDGRHARHTRRHPTNIRRKYYE